jgi:hypothetical protein
MLLAAAATYGVAASPAFGFGDLRVEGARITEEAALRAALDVPPGSNLFGLSTRPLEARVLDLGTVARVRISVVLPDTLVVEVEEREPVLSWRVGPRSFLVDADGRLFAELGKSPPPEARALRVVDDRRASSRRYRPGDSIAPVELDAASRLGSVTAAAVGSAARTLELSVTDEHGFVLGTGPGGWTAVFGFYTPTLRTTEIIPGQVQLLRSLLLGREAEVQRVVLASATDGTYLPWPSPAPGSPAP